MKNRVGLRVSLRAPKSRSCAAAALHRPHPLRRLLDRLARWLTADWQTIDPDPIITYIEQEADRR